MQLFFQPPGLPAGNMTHHRYLRLAVVSTLAVLTGIALARMPLGESWVQASYDYIYRFSGRSVTNQVALVLLDNESHDHHKQERGEWNRGLHARFFNRLADEQCPLVVLDLFFRKPGDPETDAALAESMRRLSNVVIMAEQAETAHQPDRAQPGVDSVRPMLPLPQFVDAARGNWGVAWLDADLDGKVRRHWPFPSSSGYRSLPWKAAELAGAELEDEPLFRWIRYYAPGAWTTFSYHLAETQPPGYFANKIVFVGNKPRTPLADGERDEFRPPHIRWTGSAVGGVEILMAEFLNLLNREWLQRTTASTEILVLLASGILIALGVNRRFRSLAWLVAFAAALAALIGGVCLAHYSNYWFPWLVIAGGQVPIALLASTLLRDRPVAAPTQSVIVGSTVVLPREAPIDLEHKFDIPDYELIAPPFGKGAYGEVWLARNAVGQWQALKVIYRARFGDDDEPYQREFRGIERYKRVSDEHPALLRVDFVSRMKPEGYFYYAMELGDSIVPGWERDPAIYRPLDLAAYRGCQVDKRVPIRECVRIGLVLTEALQFLHDKGLIHRDVKPHNVIFVHGLPKLADIGLVGEAGRAVADMTWVGTPGYMPPDPEPPGTVVADIYALGMVLYVISTGLKPTVFPELTTALVDRARNPDFALLSPVILKACDPTISNRYQTAVEMHAALVSLKNQLDQVPGAA